MAATMRTRPARFHDSRLDETVDASVDLNDMARRVVLRGQDGLALAMWAYGDLVVIERGGRSGPWRLGCTAQPGDWLELEDAGLAALLEARSERTETPRNTAAPLSKPPTPRTRPRTGRRPAWIGDLRQALASPLVRIGALVAALVWVVVTAGYAIPFVGARMMPMAWQQAWGERLMEEQGPMTLSGLMGERCTGEEGQMVLEALAHSLSATLDKPMPVSVRVSPRPLVGALSAPGGQVVVFRGLLDSPDGLDATADAMALEIAQLASGNLTRRSLQVAMTAGILGVFNENMDTTRAVAIALPRMRYSTGDMQRAHAIAREMRRQAALPALEDWLKVRRMCRIHPVGNA